MLGFLFFIVALLYAGVGFGGGSSYLALLVLWKLPFVVIPVIALLCNIVVVSGNSFNYIRKGFLRWNLLLPLALTSVPLSYIGGRLPIEKELFVIILFASLLVTGLRLLIHHRHYGDDPGSYRAIPLWISLFLGSVLGFLAGITGIGGGIFLAPILYYFRAGSPKQIAAVSSMFILVNSISGLLGQLSKPTLSETIADYWYLPLLALVGGQIGNLVVIKFVPARIVALLTALLVLFVAGNLAFKIWG
jgi:uncharacterized membrane protein YfcA